MSPNKPEPILLKDYHPPAFLIDAVELTFELDPSATKVTAKSSFRRNPDVDADTSPLMLDGEGLELISIALDGETLPSTRWRLTKDSLELDSPPDAFELTIVTTVDPASNKALEGLYMSSGRFCTQCEAEGFRKITYYLDRPDVLARFRVRLVADKGTYPVLLSNGNCADSGETQGGKHYAVWDDPFPKPCYLFALVAGDLARVSGHYTTASGKSVELHIYVEHDKESRAEYALDALMRSMRWDEDVYGLEYDLDIFNIVAVSDFNMGAMENKSLNIFNDKFILADPITATDTDYAWIESVVAHEYFHNWTGNRVTCRDWFQLSLKEGLTVFRDQQFSADQRSTAVQRIEDVKRLRAAQFTEDASPLAHPVRPDSYAEINNFYTHTVYEKGAEVVRMIHTLIGETAFRAGMDTYFERHDGQAVTCEDFVNAMQTASGADLTQFMLWYQQAGTPRVHVTGSYDAATRCYTLELNQSVKPSPGQPVKRPMHIPLAIGFVDRAGGSLKVTHQTKDGQTSGAHETHLISLTDQSSVYTFGGFPYDSGRPVPSINRGFSAPIIVDMDRGEDELGALLAHDPDPISRWDAAQELALRVMRKKFLDDSYEQSLNALLSSMDVALESALEDAGLAAQILSLPVESTIADSFENYDPLQIYDLRTWLQNEIGKHLCDKLVTLYESITTAVPYDPIGPEANKRALKHQALMYLTHTDYQMYATLASEQYENGESMTARASALQALNVLDSDLRRNALNDFEHRFASDSLVMDKWFTLEATHPTPQALIRVEDLKLHRTYDPENPNKIRALIGSFASGNTVGFHQISGAGYKFVADQVLEIDAFNPQTAARLAGIFQTWSRYDAKRKSLMQSELVRISSAPNLSHDVNEIVSKALTAAES